MHSRKILAIALMLASLGYAQAKGHACPDKTSEICLESCCRAGGGAACVSACQCTGVCPSQQGAPAFLRANNTNNGGHKCPDKTTEVCLESCCRAGGGAACVSACQCTGSCPSEAGLAAAGHKCPDKTSEVCLESCCRAGGGAACVSACQCTGSCPSQQGAPAFLRADGAGHKCPDKTTEVCLESCCRAGGGAACVSACQCTGSCPSVVAPELQAPEITKCGICTKIVGFAEGKILKYGCGVLTKVAGAAACEAIGLGPEDPLADVCVAIIVFGCPKIAKLLADHIRDPATICGDLGYCPKAAAAELGAPEWATRA